MRFADWIGAAARDPALAMAHMRDAALVRADRLVAACRRPEARYLRARLRARGHERLMGDLLAEDPAWLPQPSLAVLRDLSRRLRLVADDRGANRYLPHRWRMIHNEIVGAVGGAVDWDRGPVVVNFGAGTRNPLALGLLLMLRGAKRAWCVEPAPVANEPSAVAALQETVWDVVTRPADYDGIDRSLVLERLSAAVDLEALRVGAPLAEITRGRGLALRQERGESLGLPDGSVDLVYSRSVLEHVMPYRAAMGGLVRKLTPGGAMYHDIGLGGHKTGDEFWFYYAVAGHRDDDLYGLNRLRKSDWIRLFEELGCDVRVVASEKAPAGAVDRGRLIGAMTHYGEDDLVTTRLTLLARRRAT